MLDLKIFVSLHKDCYVPNNRFLIPITVGKFKKKDALSDSKGQNISALNQHFSELTAQYWAWKNVDSEYYGFFHYRRYFSFNNSKNSFNNIERGSITNDVLNEFLITEESIEKTVEQYDIIVPLHENLKKYFRFTNNLYKQYKTASQHDISDFDNAIKIIHILYPSFDKYVKKALKGKCTYFFNMYIMRKKYFHEYCNWLYPILFKLHKEKDYSMCSSYAKRMPGFISERLFTIFMYYLKDKYPNIKIKETQTIFFNNTDCPYLIPHNNNKIGICFSSSNEYAKHLSMTILSIIAKSSNKNFYDLIVLDNGISSQNKSTLKSLISKKKNLSLRFVYTKSYLISGLQTKGHITAASYSRYAIFDLLNQYKKIIFLDSDLIVNDDIAKLYKIDLRDNYVAAVRDTVMGTWVSDPHKFGKVNKNYILEKIGLENPYNYFNNGVVIYNLPLMIKNGISTKMLFNISLKEKWHWLDQDVLNCVCKNKVYYLEMPWNVMVNYNLPVSKMLESILPYDLFDSYINALKNPSIIHYAGRQQPIYNKNARFSSLYWKYAKRSPFYKDLLDIKSNGEKFNKIKIIDLAKKILPYNSKTGRFVRYLYHSIKRK